MKQIILFLSSPIFLVVIILAMIFISHEINRQIINTQTVSSSSKNSPFGTINKIYGIYFLNREAAINYCKSIPKKDAGGYIWSIKIYYPFVEEDSYTGSYFEYYLKNCEDLPKQSVCMDENNCLIKYGDGS